MKNMIVNFKTLDMEHKLSKIYNVLSFFTILIILTYLFYFVEKSGTGLDKLINNGFGQIPIIGNFLLFLIKTSNIIQLDVFNNSIFKPIFILEIVYYLLPLLLIQLFLIKMKCNIIKNKKSNMSLLLFVVLVASSIIVSRLDMFILPLAYRSILNTKDGIFHILLILQLLIIIRLCFVFSKQGSFDWREYNDSFFANRVFKIGSVVSLVLLLALGSGFTVAKLQVNSIKKQVGIEYTIVVKTNLEGHIELLLPQKLLNDMNKVGVTLTQSVDLGALMSNVTPDEIDVGAAVNGLVESTIDSLSYRIIGRPLFAVKVLSSLLLLTFALFLIMNKYGLNRIGIYTLQSLILLLVLINYGRYFGYIITIFIVMMLAGTLINLMMALNERYNIPLFISATVDTIKSNYSKT